MTSICYNNTMKYENITAAKFINRPNRFIATVEIDGKLEKAHVKNTGRLGELLIEGVQVFLEDHEGRMGTRKLRYSLIGVVKPGDDPDDVMVNIDSQAPNKVVGEALEEGRLLPCGVEKITKIIGEYKHGDSRLDFYVEGNAGEKILMEVKGVTLEVDGMAKFPDAPTQRGIKHIDELISAVTKGKADHDAKCTGACIVFVIQMKGVSAFGPNYERHRAFGEALARAEAAGVEILAYDCIVGEDTLEIDRQIPVKL